MKQMKSLLSGLAVCCILVGSAYAQKSSEFGLLLGASSYAGDLNPLFFDPAFIHPAGGLIYRHNLNYHYAFKADILYGTISGDDSHSSVPYNRFRNLSFQSPVIEGSAQYEFNFLPYEVGAPEHSFTPYIFAGLSIFYFNPKALFNGAWQELQPLGTEGQGLPGKPKPYKLIQPAIPFGMGLKWGWKDMTFGFESGLRKTFTDYLDDVSGKYVDSGVLGQTAAQLAYRSTEGIVVSGKQRGNSQSKDWYMFSGLCISFKFGGKGEGVNCHAFH